MFKTVLVALPLVALSAPAFAEGDLAIKAKKLDTLEIGTGDTGYGVSVPEYQLETGKSYKLTLKEVGPHGCEWSAEEFFPNTWIRQIDIGRASLEIAGLETVDLDDDAEVTIEFVPIRPGEYDWECEGLGEQGLTGKFVVK
ncbi:hypothetical protein [Oryzibacter oryziterrae]|uniref:hypothetical protein n=1 Tax=Oryzibacter oryziterrae TaxID=2766474 RepID=UPI001F23D7B8|nr:hypothetical protein [Oryzibacter oryziterrae]